MKKRLSRQEIASPLIVLSFSLVMFVFALLFLTLNRPANYGEVSSHGIYALHPSMVDEINQDRIDYKEIGFDTSAIAIRESGEVIVGKVSSFTSKVRDIRNKFIIPAEKGNKINITQLIRTLQKLRENDDLTDISLLIPASSLPVAIITDLIQILKNHQIFGDVLLATGLSN